MKDLLGPHSVVVALEVADRVASAHLAQQIFLNDGFEAKVFTHPQEEFPEGFLSFVTVPGLGGITVMFWPRPQDVTLELVPELPTFPKREPWTGAYLTG